MNAGESPNLQLGEDVKIVLNSFSINVFRSKRGVKMTILTAKKDDDDDFDDSDDDDFDDEGDNEDDWDEDMDDED